jgi:hypothetical protein
VEFTHAHTYTRHPDPLRLLGRSAGRRSRAGSPSAQRSRSSSPHSGDSSEKLKREQSFKANRHHKFVECLSREDVDMGSSFFFYQPRAHLTWIFFSGATKIGLVWDS